MAPTGGAWHVVPVVPIERLPDERLDDRVPADVEGPGSRIQFLQHIRGDVHVHALDLTGTA